MPEISQTNGKRIASLLIAAVIVFSLFIPSLTLTVNAEAMYIRKVVSVVYDDSGSMEGDKWAYANYAMQAFCGMLNSEDQLFITYMSPSQSVSGYQPEHVELSADGIQASVDVIRLHKDSGSTPYDAVKLAYDRLSSYQDDNLNTQYWLVVITDGIFDEVNGFSSTEATRFLNDEFRGYTSNTMPNGSKPQVTFLSIGDMAISPDQDEAKGIYTYSAADAKSITDAMSKMADRVSGRTRLKSGDLLQVDDETIEVSSEIPLLDIAVFAQRTKAKITEVVFSNELQIPVSREVRLEYPGYKDLTGHAFLIGDTQRSIGAGTYRIKFDQPIRLDDVVVLFEPALEMRMVVYLNGKLVQDPYELENAMAGDKISVACKIYETGTDNEIDPDLLPSDTEFSVAVSEDGTKTKESVGKELSLEEYVLNSRETEVQARISIGGFKPIEYSLRFTPAEYVPQPVYRLEAEYGSDVHSVSAYQIQTNQDLQICFSVYADDVLLEASDAVLALKPAITTSGAGNDGLTEITDDGRIVFTPNKLGVVPAGVEYMDVEVFCTLEDGTVGSLSYLVLMADYQVVPTGVDSPIKKTEFYDNQFGASFQILKDGVKMDKSEIEGDCDAVLSPALKGISVEILVEPDGTVRCTPYSDEPYRLTFGSWWINWWHYLFELPGRELTVTLTHRFGSASQVIPVKDESVIWILLNVALPFLLELAALIFLITWIVLYITKPRYEKGAVLYVADIRYNTDKQCHVIRNFSKVRLDKFNTFKYLWKFKRNAEVINVNGINVRADYSGRIICEEPMPWYHDRLKPIDYMLDNLRTPEDVAGYFDTATKLEIREFSMMQAIEGDASRSIVLDTDRSPKYYVITDSDTGVKMVDGRRVIREGSLFTYSIG